MPKFTRWIEAAPAEPVPAAAVRSLHSRFEPLQHYLPLAAYEADENIEYVHQARVWSRRANAAIRVYRDLLPRKLTKWLQDQLRRIRAGTNDARDADVLIARLRQDLAAPGAAALLEQTVARRQEVQAAIVGLHEYLQGDGRLTRKCDKLLRRVRWRGAARKLAEPGFGAWAPMRLRRIAAKFFAAAEADLSDVAALHDFRIRSKKLRYAMELLAEGLGNLRAAAYPLVQEIQNRLGAINDRATAVQRLTPRAAETPTSEQNDYLQHHLAAEAQQLAHLRSDFFAWWTAARRQELRAMFDQALAAP